MMQKQYESYIFQTKYFSKKQIISSNKQLSNQYLKNNNFFKNIINPSIRYLEKLMCQINVFGKSYGKWFYNKMIQSELDMANLKKGANVLMIGCGSLPITAMHLSNKGFNVTGIDNDDKAITNAEQFKKSNHFQGDIQFKKQDALTMDYSTFDAIWVAFSIHPKTEILAKIYDQLQEGGKIIYRNPGKHIKRLYSTVDPYLFSKNCKFNPQNFFGKQSILLIKNGKRTTIDENVNPSTENCFTLMNMKLRQKAVICSCPCEQSCLSVLGLRPGKQVKALAKQPFGGPVLASVDGRMIALDKEIAEKIMVF